ncbi:hypothetical protein [Hyphomicrobium sp. CS1BSMeth3]|uniref:hypothetical protein n=1 Tax=Hyphomicrobium sp. CS1BSMeth3 TaxID=1892844 RepID=UPI00092FF22E|nr:hypothetical protein [Hyphomicrobium sp. CS1BSMeth3]
MKTKIGIYLTDDVARRLDRAVRAGGTKSDIVNTALERFLDPASAKGPYAEVLARLEAQRKLLRRIRREVEVTAEAFALFVRYFLMVTPPLPESEQEEARQLGRARLKVFLKEVGRRVASDGSWSKDVLQTAARTRGADGFKPRHSANPPRPADPAKGGSHG